LKTTIEFVFQFDLGTGLEQSRLVFMSDTPIELTPERPQPAKTSRYPILVKLIRLFGTLAVVGSMLSFFAAYHWIADIVSQLTVQFLVLLAPAAMLAWHRKQKWLATFVILLMGSQLLKILPYYLPPPDGIEKRLDVPSYRLAIFNVLRTNEQFQETLDIILATEADVIYLMEVQPAWDPYLSSIKNQYPYQSVLADPAYTGVALLSKHPWRKLEIIKQGFISNPTYDLYLQLGGDESQEIRLIATHPLPPFGAELTKARDDQLTALVDRFNDGEANLLCGDFNLSPWSPRFQALCQHGSLVDGALGFGLAPTLIPLPTPLGGIKVDHVLRNEKIRVHDYRVLRNRFSDHGIVVFDFSVNLN